MDNFIDKIKELEKRINELEKRNLPSDIAYLSDIPSKASGSDINLGQDDSKYATSKAIADSLLWGEWRLINENIIYNSPSSVKIINKDLRNKYKIGTAIKFIQNSNIKNFFIISNNFSDNNTILNLESPANHIVENTTINNPLYSYNRNPTEFIGVEKLKAYMYILNNFNRTQDINTFLSWIRWDRVLYDYNNNCDLSTNNWKYIVPLSGFYLITIYGKARVLSDYFWAAGVQLSINNNTNNLYSGSYIYVYPNSNAKYTEIISNFTSLIKLSKNDYLKGIFYADNTSSYLYGGEKNTFLSVSFYDFAL